MMSTAACSLVVYLATHTLACDVACVLAMLCMQHNALLPYTVTICICDCVFKALATTADHYYVHRLITYWHSHVTILLLSHAGQIFNGLHAERCCALQRRMAASSDSVAAIYDGMQLARSFRNGDKCPPSANDIEFC
jgi:hypothetical protein